MTDKCKCGYCGKKENKTNRHWSCTYLKIDESRVVHYYACNECFKKYVMKELNNDK